MTDITYTILYLYHPMIMTMTQKQQSFSNDCHTWDGEARRRGALEISDWWASCFHHGFPKLSWTVFWWFLMCFGGAGRHPFSEIPRYTHEIIYTYIYIYMCFLPMIIMIRLTTTMIVNSNIIYQQWWCDIKQTRIIKSVWSQDDLMFSPSKPSRKARSLALMPPNSRENYWMPARMMRSENHRCGWRKSCTSW